MGECIQFTHRLRNIMLLSIGLAALFSVAGLWASYVLDIASGATIIVVSGIAFFVASLPRKIRWSLCSGDSSQTSHIVTVLNHP